MLRLIRMSASARWIVPGVRHHVREQLPEHLVLELVHLVVALQDAPGQVGVPLDEGVEGVPGHGLGDLGHPRDVDEGLERCLGQDLDDVLGDVHGLIADPLEVVVDLEGRGDEPEIRRRRLLQGQERDAAVVDLDLEVVDLLVRCDHDLGLVEAAVDEGADRSVGVLLHERPHREQALLQGLQLFFVTMPFHGRCLAYPNRPVR